MNQDSKIYNLLCYAAIAGNIVFVLWITYNGIDEGFRGTTPEKISYIGLTVLLLINSFLIYSRRSKN